MGYPTGGYRIFLLAIVVLANIVFTWTVAQAHQARVAEELRRLKTGERALGS